MESSATTGLPSSGRLVGIDYGTVRIGIAISDVDQKIASPFETYTRRNEKLDAEYFADLISRENAVGFVVGLPIHMSGDESKKSIEARAFGNWLTASTSKPVVWIDERYTTALAREMLSDSSLSGKKKKAMVDKIAAQAILAAFLETHRVKNQKLANQNRSLDG